MESIQKPIIRHIKRESKIEKKETEYFINETSRNTLLENCKKTLKMDFLVELRNIVVKYSRISGRNFEANIYQIGNYRERLSKGMMQIDRWIIQPGMDETRWIINPKILKEFNEQFSTMPIKSLQHCRYWMKRLAVTEKNDLIKTNKVAKFRIDMLSSSGNVGSGDMVLYSGYVAKEGNSYYFVDDYYYESLSDWIEIECFPPIDTGGVYIMIGELLDKHSVVPHALLKIDQKNIKSIEKKIHSNVNFEKGKNIVINNFEINVNGSIYMNNYSTTKNKILNSQVGVQNSSMNIQKWNETKMDIEEIIHKIRTNLNEIPIQRQKNLVEEELKVLELEGNSNMPNLTLIKKTLEMIQNNIGDDGKFFKSYRINR